MIQVQENMDEGNRTTWSPKALVDGTSEAERIKDVSLPEKVTKDEGSSKKLEQNFLQKYI